MDEHDIQQHRSKQNRNPKFVFHPRYFNHQLLTSIFVLRTDLTDVTDASAPQPTLPTSEYPKPCKSKIPLIGGVVGGVLGGLLLVAVALYVLIRRGWCCKRAQRRSGTRVMFDIDGNAEVDDKLLGAAASPRIEPFRSPQAHEFNPYAPYDPPSNQSTLTGTSPRMTPDQSFSSIQMSPRTQRSFSPSAHTSPIPGSSRPLVERRIPSVEAQLAEKRRTSSLDQQQRISSASIGITYSNNGRSYDHTMASQPFLMSQPHRSASADDANAGPSNRMFTPSGPRRSSFPTKRVWQNHQQEESLATDNINGIYMIRGSVYGDIPMSSSPTEEMAASIPGARFASPKDRGLPPPTYIHNGQA